MSLLEQFAAKAQITGDLGEGLDINLQKAEEEVHKLQGGYLWLKESVNGLKGLSEHIRKDFDEGKYDGLDAKNVHDLLLDYNRKSIECILNFAELKKSEGLAASGKVSGIKASLELVQKHHHAVTARAAQITAAIEDNEAPPEEKVAKASRKSRAPGEHPGPSPLDERRHAELKKSFKKKSSKKKSKKKVEE